MAFSCAVAQRRHAAGRNAQRADESSVLQHDFLLLMLPVKRRFPVHNAVSCKAEASINSASRSTLAAQALARPQKRGLYNDSMGFTSRAYRRLRRPRAYLDNGLKVLVQELHTAPLVSVWCWYRVGSRDEGPGRTGVSHWVEHMNFKGTANIPRDQMKGLVERFGGTWNGYTWIDQTTYLETAGHGRARPAAVHRSRTHGERSLRAGGCESERTVIISELQGGENDPDQLLDTEVTATAFRAHPYRHPTIGWICRSAIDDPRRSVRPLPPLLRSEQRDARRRRRRGYRGCAAARRANTSAAIPPAPRRRALSTSSRRRSASAASLVERRARPRI